MEWTEMALRLGVALLMGALVGCDREVHHKPAGLKTHALVALGSATFTLISLEFLRTMPTGQNYDPLRLVAGIIGGIGFLGAGAIIQAPGNVRGITTAAGVWMVGAIGVACGAGFYMIAGLSMAGVLLILYPVRAIEKRFVHRDNDSE
ncbi:MAG: MgtC/SapB family protein [Phycisphaera sp.]|nr:MgtC/SapB family protein [Phycisphaera sp.]